MSNRIEKRSGQQQASVHLQKTETSVSLSPLPPAAELERIEQFSPGVTDRLLSLIENEQQHRWQKDKEILDLERTHLKNNNLNVRIGLFFGLISVFVISGMCVYFAYLGDINSAKNTAIAVIVALAGLFITGRVVKAKSQAEK